MESFAADTPVLRFALPRVRPHRGPRWILWPAWGFRVVAPYPRERKLDVFQKAVLGLAHAGKRTVDEITERLLVHKDLVAYVVLELQSREWMDARGAPTTSGCRVLEEEAETIEDEVVGWVFTDPFTGDLWPRFHAGELPYAQTQPGERGYPVMVSGSHGDPRRDVPFCVLPRWEDAVVMTQPRKEDILRAVRAHRRHLDWHDSPDAADAPRLRRVSFVEEQPAAHLLAARAFADPGKDWQVDDPFGIGESPRLRRWIEGRLDVHPGLRAWLAPVAGGAEESADLQAVFRRAEWAVEEKLTLAIRSRTMLYERLVAMQRALLETELPDCPEDKWDDVALKAQRVVERLLLDLRDRHPPRVALADTPAANEALLEGLARAAGFETPLPDSLVRVRRGKVQHALEHGSGSLRPLLLTALLGTGGGAHPFVSAARERPDLLHRLNELASLRDEAGHESRRRDGERPERRRERTRNAVETVFSAVKLVVTT